MIKKMFSLLSFATTFLITSGEELHINVRTGKDANPGTQLALLNTLQEAAKRINANNGKTSATIFIAAGVYPLTETVLFNNNKFTWQSRLIIRAEILPDDANWNPQCMPIIITVVPTLPRVDGENATGGLLTIENVRTTSAVEIEKNQSKNSYLQLKAGSLGSELTAGLFKSK